MLLVGDIDRGGVFASLVGHMELFTPPERELVAVFVINRFRGDVAQLEPGVAFLTRRTGVPTLGVVPMLEDWHGDEEDAVGLEDGRRSSRVAAPLRIAVIRLPYISNHTDFDALAGELDVDVSYVTRANELAGAAAIMLAGTKSTIADLAWLRDRGLAAALAAAAAAGTPIVGVCGGYQMLGRRLADPEGVEAPAGSSVTGLGLLDVETVFAGEKHTRRVSGKLHGGPLGGAGTPLRGYEIHMGRTTLGKRAAPLLRAWAADGLEHDDGAFASDAGTFVCGSYMHGLFDHPELRQSFLDPLRVRLGLRSQPTDTSSQNDIGRLAAHVEDHLDMELLDRIIGLSEP